MIQNMINDTHNVKEYRIPPIKRPCVPMCAPKDLSEST